HTGPVPVAQCCGRAREIGMGGLEDRRGISRGMDMDVGIDQCRLRGSRHIATMVHEPGEATEPACRTHAAVRAGQVSQALGSAVHAAGFVRQIPSHQRELRRIIPMSERVLPTTPVLSVIVPFYNEEDNIERMHRAITDAVEPLGVTFEMLLVNDGSKDNTLALAIALSERDPRVRVVNFRRNYGQTPAMAAGIEHARGEILITMDGDLQNDP